VLEVAGALLFMELCEGGGVLVVLVAPCALELLELLELLEF
jgi:hypothetical protein